MILDFFLLMQHLLSVRIDASDVAGVETKVRKGEFRFYLNRPGDGKYVFKVPSETVREEWISKLQRVINVCKLAGVYSYIFQLCVYETFYGQKVSYLATWMYSSLMSIHIHINEQGHSQGSPPPGK